MSSPWSKQDTKNFLVGGDKFLIIDSNPSVGTTINKQVSFNDLINSLPEVQSFTESIDAVMEIDQSTESDTPADIITVGTQPRKIEGFKMKQSATSLLNFKLAVPPGIVNNILSRIRITFVTLSANDSKVVRLGVDTSYIANSEAVDGFAFNSEALQNIDVPDTINSVTVVDFPLIQGGSPVGGDFLIGHLTRLGNQAADTAEDILVTKIQLITTVFI